MSSFSTSQAEPSTEANPHSIAIERMLVSRAAPGSRHEVISVAAVMSGEKRVLLDKDGQSNPSPFGRGYREAAGEGRASSGPSGHLLPRGEGIARHFVRCFGRF